MLGHEAVLDQSASIERGVVDGGLAPDETQSFAVFVFDQSSWRKRTVCLSRVKGTTPLHRGSELPDASSFVKGERHHAAAPWFRIARC